MSEQSYHQFCPVAMAAEVLCTRWTVVLLRELLAGTTRFNELRRGLPRISPALLSQRLKELEAWGIVERRPVEREPGVFEYHLTPAGRRPAIAASGMNTPSSTTSFEPVPRMPSTCQVGSIRTPSAVSGTAKCSTVGPASGSS